MTLVYECPVGRQILHPNTSSLLKGQSLGVFRNSPNRDNRHLSIDAVGSYIERRDSADGFTYPSRVHVGTYRLNNAGGFVTELRRKHRLREILSHSEHYFRAVEADGLDANAYLARGGLRKRHIIKLEYVGAPCSMESNDFNGSGCWFAHEKPAWCCR